MFLRTRILKFHSMIERSLNSSRVSRNWRTNMVVEIKEANDFMFFCHCLILDLRFFNFAATLFARSSQFAEQCQPSCNMDSN
jgi:hypothetical protein